MSSFRTLPALLAATFAAGIVVGRQHPAPVESRVYELRTYTTPPGRLPALENRFRGHTLALFTRHGMTNIGYWTPQDSAHAQNTLVYLLAHPSREIARQSWAAFSADTEWQRVQAASEADGKVVSHVESVFLDPTDFSPMR